MEEKWRHRSLLDDRCRKNRDSPSFSSTLLDAIYRSIDEGGGQEAADEGLALYKEATRRKQQHINPNKSFSAVREYVAASEKEADMGSLRRAILIEKWLQKKVKSPATASAAVEFEKTDARRGGGGCVRCREYPPLVHSSSSSSDSSCGGGFSSSEAESIHGVGDVQRALKPVRTTTTTTPTFSSRIDGSEMHKSYFNRDHQKKSSCATAPARTKNEGAFSISKTKSKALKLYGDLKSAKQPTSPGARLAGFLNSILLAKKPKATPSSSLRKVSVGGDSNADRKSKPSAACYAPTASSASSFSRSCLSLTPSTREKLSSGGGAGKRSARCGTASVAVDEVSRHRQANKMEDLKGYHHRQAKKMGDMSTRHESDLVDDDVSSCCSSDLFELDHLSAAIGMDLPVYQSTRLHTKRVESRC